MTHHYKKQVLALKKDQFEDFALEIFRFQAKNNPIYALYLNYLKTDISKINAIEQIPFLPIDFFKNHIVKSSQEATQLIFESSGTTGQIRSKHHVSDLDFYEKVAIQIFEKQYGSLSEYVLLALLPNYLEKGNSSLVFMIQKFMQKTDPESGFFLYNFDELAKKIVLLRQKNKKIVLWGVTFALLDFAQDFPLDLSEQLVMDTGGMKGRGKEFVRAEIRQILEKAFQTPLHSEYGMTELLSQAYAKDGFFESPIWFKVYLRDINDPFCIDNSFRQGGINVVDLANIDSCCFIETKDIGRLQGEKFEVLGRYDHSDVRGCNLLYV